MTLKPSRSSRWHKVLHYAITGGLLLFAGLVFLSIAAVAIPVGEERAIGGVSSEVIVDADGVDNEWLMLAVEFDRDVLADLGPPPLPSLARRVHAGSRGDAGPTNVIELGSPLEASADSAWLAAGTAAGLEIDYIESATVVSSSDPTFQEGDVIIDVGKPANSRGETEILVIRDDERIRLNIPAGGIDGVNVTSRVQITGENQRPNIEAPADITGESAGLPMALALYDHLDDDFVTDGTVAATGVISADGTVGEIEGVPFKVQAAVDGGAAVIIVPSGNLKEAQIAAGNRIKVYGVDTLQDAIDLFK